MTSSHKVEWNDAFQKIFITRLADESSILTETLTFGQAEALARDLNQVLATYREHTLYWHPGYDARPSLEDGRPLWGSERLEMKHQGKWINGVVGYVNTTASIPVFIPNEKEYGDYISFVIGKTIVRNVSEPYGDGSKFILSHRK